MPELVRLSWTDFHLAIDRLAQHVESSTVHDVLVGVARGGLPGLTALSSRLQLPDVAVAFARSTLDDSVFAQRKPVVTCEALAATVPLAGKRALIFDDIVRSGRTISAVDAELRLHRVASVDVVALFKEPGQEHYADVTIDADTWIRFPWDDWPSADT